MKNRILMYGKYNHPFHSVCNRLGIPYSILWFCSPDEIDLQVFSYVAASQIGDSKKRLVAEIARMYKPIHITNIPVITALLDIYRQIKQGKCQ